MTGVISLTSFTINTYIVRCIAHVTSWVWGVHVHTIGVFSYKLSGVCFSVSVPVSN